MNISLASYNIHRCYGQNGDYNPAAIRQVLREMNADVVALQEVELLHDNPGLLEYFCEHSGWSAIPGLTMSRVDGHYGNALLTSLPVLSVDRADLSVANHEPRGALSVRMQCGKIILHVIATHLGLWPSERRKQVHRLLELINDQEPDQKVKTYTVLMGDMNEWFLWGRPLRWLKKYFQKILAPASYPASFPILSLDRILVKPEQPMVTLLAWKTRLSKTASDHLPLYARIRCDDD